MTFTRRDAIAAGAGAAALATLPAFARAPDAKAELDALAEEWLRLSPEGATSLGIDTGARAALRRASSDPTAAGRERRHAWVRSAIGRLEAVQASKPDAESARTAEVALAAWRTSADGFGFPYGTVSIAGWRNGPYAVAQNMGSYLDTPKFLDANQPVKSAADADAYLARLANWPRQLDAETLRLRQARGLGVVAPDFILDKTLAGLKVTRSDAPAAALVVTSLAKRATFPGDWAARAERIVAGEVMPAPTAR